MKNYAETKKELDRIRNEYGCKGDMIFRPALQYVVEHGQYRFRHKRWVQKQLKRVDRKHNRAEKKGKTLWIGREFEKALIECASEIAKVDAYNMLVYVQKEVFLSNEGGIDYDRAVHLLKRCMNWVEENHSSLWETYDMFDDLGFNDEELETLGFAYLLDVKEDEENDN